MLFASTAVANGAGVGIVNSIGMATEIGKIQAQIQEAAKEEDDTPLKKKIDEFGELLAKVGTFSGSLDNVRVKQDTSSVWPA